MSVTLQAELETGHKDLLLEKGEMSENGLVKEDTGEAGLIKGLDLGYLARLEVEQGGASDPFEKQMQQDSYQAQKNQKLYENGHYQTRSILKKKHRMGSMAINKKRLSKKGGKGEKGVQGEETQVLDQQAYTDHTLELEQEEDSGERGGQRVTFNNKVRVFRVANWKQYNTDMSENYESYNCCGECQVF